MRKFNRLLGRGSVGFYTKRVTLGGIGSSENNYSRIFLLDRYLFSLWLLIHAWVKHQI